jgi:DNA-binding MarR family transcriptional regulator
LTTTIDVVNNNVALPDAAAPEGEEMRREATVSARKQGLKSEAQPGVSAPVRASDGALRRTLSSPELGELDRHLGYFARRFQVWVFQDFIRTLATVDISPAQYSVLVVIGTNRGLSQSDLADCLGIERARLVRLLDRLEKRGLTERKASATDRRTHALHLTKAGQKLLRRANELADLHEARLVEKLGPQQHKLLIDMLRNFVRN